MHSQILLMSIVDLFASSSSESEPEVDNSSDEDFIADDNSRTGFLSDEEQNDLDREVYSKSLREALNISLKPKRPRGRILVESESDESESERRCRIRAENLRDNNDDDTASTLKQIRKTVDNKKHSKRGRGRPPKGSATQKDSQVKLPGDPTYPLNSFSLTISKAADDVDRQTLDTVHNYLSRVCTQSLVSFESGSKKHNLHIQGIFSMLFPRTPASIAQLRKILKALLPLYGRGYKVMIKPLGLNQTFSAMIGYCTKDQGRPHYQLRNHNVSLEVMHATINV